jgi:tetratricopeptide (TPR) repeat protein
MPFDGAQGLLVCSPRILAGTTLGIEVSVALVVVAALSLGLAAVVLIRDRNRRRAISDSSVSVVPPESQKPAQAGAGRLAPRADEETLPLPPTTPAEDKPPSVGLPSRQQAVEAEEQGDWLRAAELYRRRSDLLAERRVLRNHGDLRRLAELELALGELESGVELLRRALLAEPLDESLRLLLIQSLLDLGRIEAARDLLEAVKQEDLPGGYKASAEFLHTASCCFQAVGEFELALELCDGAYLINSAVGDAAARTVYLTKLAHLAKVTPITTPQDVQKGFLSAALSDDVVALPDIQAVRHSAPGTGPHRHQVDKLLCPHEVIVGHLALGGSDAEAPVSVRSLASTSSRLELVRLVGERPTSVVFEGVDRLLDYPVAVRLSRISSSEEHNDLIRARIRALAAVNHPNVSKVTFADRFGPVVRIVTEFHSGGNLIALLGRLDQLGLPLALRMLLQISAGLEAAHKHGIMHGDLRPENVMVGHDNLVKLVDFALKPFPVHRLRSEDSTAPTGVSRIIPTSELQSDIVQFADVIETVLACVTFTPPTRGEGGSDPMDELLEVVERARSGGFSSLSPLHRVLLEILDKTLPIPR